MTSDQKALDRREAALPAPGSGQMFDRIAHRYDLLNRILSFGIDKGWRRRAVAALELKDGAEVLDLATGTGDLALDIARRHPSSRVEGLDPSGGMLAVGRRKVEAAGLAGRVRLVEGDAQKLPYDADRFDGVTIAFGIRNVPDRPAALREMARVCRPGGRVAILELGEPRAGMIGPLARLWVHSVVPRIGGLLVSRREYQYLQDSIARFPAPETFAGIMAEAGLEVLAVRPLTFGACTLYVGTPAAGGTPA